MQAILDREVVSRLLRLLALMTLAASLALTSQTENATAQAVTPMAATTSTAPSRTLDPVMDQLRVCVTVVREIMSIKSALSALGKIKAALGVAACASAAGVYLGMKSAEAICRATWFWGPFGAGPRRFVGLISGGQFTRC